MRFAIAAQIPNAKCPLCGSVASILHECLALPIFDCSGCGHHFAVPERIDSHIVETYDDDYFCGDGAGYKNYLDERDLLVARGEYYGGMLTKHGYAGTVLDVGSAAGFLLRGMVNTGWSGLGVEPNPRLVTYARETMGVDSVCCSFESFTSAIRYDAISMIQVISHVVNPKDAIKKAVELLHPKGLLLIETWDRNSWVARLLGRRWHEYSPPSVLHWFTRPRLMDLIHSCSMEIIETGRTRRWIQVGHARSLMRHKYGVMGSVPLCWLPSRVRVPYLGDDLIYVLARKK